MTDEDDVQRILDEIEIDARRPFTADRDATNMAVAIRLALKFLPAPELDPDPHRAVAAGALRGALSAHERRLLDEGR